MDYEEVVRRLKGERNRLADFHMKSLAVFGSVSRGEARADSDVDFLVEFEGPATFDRYMGLKIFLEDTLDTPVDLLTKKGIRPELAPYVEREARDVA